MHAKSTAGICRLSRTNDLVDMADAGSLSCAYDWEVLCVVDSS